MKIPSLTTSQMMEVDRMMVEDFGILLIQMMENAGRNLASLTIDLLDGKADPHVVVLCGGGNNGGGGMAAARHLHNRGAHVKVALAADAANLGEVPTRQWAILRRMGLPDAEPADLTRADFILDALIGYGVRGNPRGAVGDWIREANAAAAPILALDVPSGLDATSGTPGNPCIRASATLTLALPKVGLTLPSAQEYAGDLYLADISVPPELYARLGVQVGAIFARATVLRLSD